MAHIKNRCIPDGPSHPEPTSTNTYRAHMGSMWVFSGENRTSNIVFAQLKTRCIPDGPSHPKPTNISHHLHNEYGVRAHLCFLTIYLNLQDIS